MWRYEIAGDQIPADWADCARDLLCQHADKVEWVEFHDAAENRYRAARIENGRLESCIFIDSTYNLPQRDWLVKLFADDKLNDKDRTSILMGKPAKGQKDPGRVVCSCFGVGINTLIEKIKANDLTTPEAIGEKLKAGTNCGSCIPELKEIIQSTQSIKTLSPKSMGQTTA